MIDLNKHFTSLYRFIAVTFLAIIFIIAISYAVLVAFFAINNTWGSPITLSPTQPRVMAFQPQVATLVLNLNKQKAELSNAILIKKNILEQLINIDTVAIKMEEAMVIEKRRAMSTSTALDSLITSKKENIKQSEQVLSELNLLNKQVDDELAAKLITSDQAAQRRISIQSSKNAFTELETGTTQLSVQSTQLKDFAYTLAGKNKSLVALAPTKQIMEMDALKSQLKLQLITSEQNVEIVRKAMAADNRILQIAMTSPYYAALWAPTPVLFIPYDNLDNVKKDAPIYDCWLQILFCSKVGTLGEVFEAEEYAKHPLFKTDLKGRFASMILTDKTAANSQVLFIGSKPLLI